MMLSLVVETLLVSDVVGTAMVPLIMVGATSNKLLNVIDNRCSSANDVADAVFVDCLRFSLQSDDVSFVERGSRLFFL